MSEGELFIKCVRSSDENCSPGLQEAFETISKHGIQTEWISPQKCLEFKEKSRNVAFVFDPFEGEAFAHLSKLTFRILGPQCILSSLLMKIDIPRKKTPVYNLAMKDLTISCSSIDKDIRIDIHDKIELMGGTVIKNFTDHVTHLVCGEVGSKKYQVAASLNKIIMSAEWVNAVWEKSRYRHVHASDDQFTKYHCPLFKGYVISVSGLSQEKRKEIKKLIESEGGQYSGEMKCDYCTHLITDEPKGTKYMFAVKWKIYTVTSNWVYVSIDRGYCQPEEEYKTGVDCGNTTNNNNHTLPHTTSTPTKDLSRIQESHLGDLSAISNMSTVNGHHMESTVQFSRRNSSLSDQQQPLILDVDVNKTVRDFFLDGLKIYLSGFRNPNLDKLRKIVNVGGATRFNNINESITHVVIGEHIESDINLLKSGEFRPHVVSAQWLVDCYKQEKQLDESTYSCLDLPALSTNSPLVKSKPKPSRQSKEGHDSTLAAAAAAFDDDMDILSQYLPNQQQNTTQINTTVAHVPEEPEPESQDQSTFVEGQMFSGKKFIFFGFDNGEMDSLVEMVESKGGKIVAENKRVVADYGVVPLLGYPVTVAVTEVITYAWVQMCLESETLLDIEANPLFKPLDIGDSKPLEGCVLSISGYSGVQRNCIVNIAEVIGAKCQDHFVRRPHKGHDACSHLIVNEPDGPKYKAAVKWNVPAVSKYWIFECGKKGKRLPEDKFLVTEHDESEMESQIQPPPHEQQQGLTASSTKRSTNTPSRGQPPDADLHVKNNVKPNTINAQSKSSNEIESAAEKTNDNHHITKSSNEKVISSSAEEKVASSSAESGKFNENNPMAEFTNQRLKNRAFQDNQLSNVRNSDLLKPNSPQLKPKHSRLQELKTPGTPGPGTPKMDTPSKFLAPGIEFHPNYNLTEIMKELQSPDNNNRRDSLAELTSTIQKATELSAVPVERCPTPLASRPVAHTPVALRPLARVTIYVSKKLAANISQYHDIVSDLGGEYQWKYTPSCTHVIFQGRANDINKEFRTAREDKKFVVSSHWLLACQEQQSRVEESLYPHNHNPKLCLNVKATPGRIKNSQTPVRPGRQVPSRSTRATNSQVKTLDISPKNFPKFNLNLENNAAETTGSDAKNSSDSDREVTRHSKNRLRTKKSSESEKDEKSKSSSESESRSKSDRENERNKTNESSESDKERHEQIENNEEVTEQQLQDMDSGGTLEMKLAISKQLEDMAAKSKKSSKRKSRRLNSSGNLRASGGSSTTESRPSSRQDNWDKSSEKRSTRPNGKPEENDITIPTESQSVLVTWDDPVGRLEKEKLAAKLEQACSPTQTQNTEDYMAGMDIPENAQYSEVEDNHNSSTDDEQVKKNSPTGKRTPTPEAPSLAFPIKRQSLAVKAPEPVELLQELACDEPDQEQPSKPQYIFLLSGMNPEERVEYGALIEQLGGKVFDGQHFENSATHLVTGTPGRNEKFLACVAAGKWILHKSYFEACRKEKKFVQEDRFEWGGQLTKSLQGINASMLKLASSAHRWRCTVQEMSKTSKSVGAFSGWKVILATQKSKESNFSRLLVAGGAIVLTLKPPYPCDLSATHAFVELHKVPLNQADLETLLMCDVLCLKPEFIPAYLIDANTCTDDFTPTEISSLRACLPDSATNKRKFNTSNSQNKRSRKN